MLREIVEGSGDTKETNGYRVSYRFDYRSDDYASVGEIGVTDNFAAHPVNSNFSLDDVLKFFQRNTKKLGSNGEVTVSDFKKDTKFITWLSKRIKTSKGKV